MVDKIPLWKQALWLAEHLECVHSPDPLFVPDDEVRGKLLVRFITVGYQEHEDKVFKKDHEELRGDKIDEWVDGELYDLVDKYGWKLDERAGRGKE